MNEDECHEIAPSESLRRAMAAEYVINTGASPRRGPIVGIADIKQARAVTSRALKRAGLGGAAEGGVA